MAPVPNLSAGRRRALTDLNQLPAGFRAIRDILDGSYGFTTNVMGVITDARTPIDTSGKDKKSTCRLIDTTVDGMDEVDSLEFCLFRPEHQHPVIRNGDVIILRTVKIQSYRGGISALSTHVTQLALFDAAQLRENPLNPNAAQRQVANEIGYRPSPEECARAGWLLQNINECRIPTADQFQVMVAKSANSKEKFSVLKDIEPGTFYDLIVKVARRPHDQGDRITLWVTDYTKNPAFYCFPERKNSGLAEREGDPYGYCSKFSNTGNITTAPDAIPGQLSLQITCYEPHASAIREEAIDKGAWVSIRNVQVKYGSNQANLEGFLREDLEYGAKIGITQLDLEELRRKELIPTTDQRLRDALRRNRDYDKERKGLDDSIVQAAQAGQKRKSVVANDNGFNTENAKTRRRKRRMKKQEGKLSISTPEDGYNEHEHHTTLQDAHRRPEIDEESSLPTLGLNPAVKCEHSSEQPSTVASILKRTTVQTDVGDHVVDLTLPFVCRNHRLDVRVVDYYPHDMRKFARPKKPAQYDMLSDNEESDEEDYSDTDMDFNADAESHDWEWRISLLLEDASTAASRGSREQVWVVVDNKAAQCLTNLDASNLYRDADNLNALQEAMSVLWGNLAQTKEPAFAAQRARPLALADAPPPDSSDVENQVAKAPLQLDNKPFNCCVKQYGVRIRDDDPENCNAGDGFRWDRIFGLYGTRVVLPA